MNPEQLAEQAVDAARTLAQANPATAAAFALVEGIVRLAVSRTVREVNVTAAGVDIEDARSPGKGAVVEDLRGVDSSAR